MATDGDRMSGDLLRGAAVSLWNVLRLFQLLKATWQNPLGDRIPAYLWNCGLAMPSAVSVRAMSANASETGIGVMPSSLISCGDSRKRESQAPAERGSRNFSIIQVCASRSC